MKKYIKKSFIAIGSTASIAAPVMAAISCSADVENRDNWNKLVNNWQYGRGKSGDKNKVSEDSGLVNYARRFEIFASKYNDNNTFPDTNIANHSDVNNSHYLKEETLTKYFENRLGGASTTVAQRKTKLEDLLKWQAKYKAFDSIRVASENWAKAWSAASKQPADILKVWNAYVQKLTYAGLEVKVTADIAGSGILTTTDLSSLDATKAAALAAQFKTNSTPKTKTISVSVGTAAKYKEGLEQEYANIANDVKTKYDWAHFRAPENAQVFKAMWSYCLADINELVSRYPGGYGSGKDYLDGAIVKDYANLEYLKNTSVFHIDIPTDQQAKPGTVYRTSIEKRVFQKNKMLLNLVNFTNKIEVMKSEADGGYSRFIELYNDNRRGNQFWWDWYHWANMYGKNSQDSHYKYVIKNNQKIVFKASDSSKDWNNQAITLTTAEKAGAHNYTNPMYKNQTLLKLVKDVAQGCVDQKVYYSGQQEYVNWWFYEISFPGVILTALNGVQRDLSTTELITYMSGYNYYKPNPLYGHSAKGSINGFKPAHEMLSTGGNLADNSLNAIKAAVLSRDEEKIQETVASLYQFIFMRFSQEGDGFYRDGGFIQHGNIGYMGAYGAVLFKAVADVADILYDSDWDLFKLEPRFTNLFITMQKSVMPFMYRGVFSPSLAGRSLSRGSKEDLNARGMEFLLQMARLSLWAPKSFKDNTLAPFIKQQLYFIGKRVANGEIPKPARYDDHIFDEFKLKTGEQLVTQYETEVSEQAITGDLSTSPSDGLDGLRQMWSIDRVVQKQPGFMATVSYHSDRVGNFEGMNGENLQGFYQGDGMTMVHTSEYADMYNGDYWWGVDPYELPGVTSDTSTKTQTDAMPAAGSSDDAWRKWIDHHSQSQIDGIAGGTTFGHYGAAIGKSANFVGSLTTSRSTFNLDGEIFFLGRTSSNGTNINTTIDNRTTSTYAANGMGDYLESDITVPNADGTSGTLKAYSYTGEHNEKMNYVMFDGAVQESHVQTTREAQQTNRGYITDSGVVKDWHGKVKNGWAPYHQNYFNRLFVNHDSAEHQTYAYSVVPGNHTAADLAKRAKRIKVVANNQQVQAIEYTNDKGETFLMANFAQVPSNLRTTFLSDPAAAGEDPEEIDLSLSKPGSVIIKKTIHNGKSNFQMTARAAKYDKSPLVIKFSKAVESIHGPWISWPEQGHANIKVDPDNFGESLYNWEHQTSTADYDIQELNNGDRFVNVQQVTIHTDERYRYNPPVAIRFRLES